MRTVLTALVLLAASLASLGPAAAECIEGACITTYHDSAGTCDAGYATNNVFVTSFDANGFVIVQAGTFCAAGPGYAVTTLAGSAIVCDASYRCASATLFWEDFAYGGGSSCTSEAYVFAAGQSLQQALPLCETVGAPPAVPALPALP